VKLGGSYSLGGREWGLLGAVTFFLRWERTVDRIWCAAGIEVTGICPEKKKLKPEDGDRLRRSGNIRVLKKARPQRFVSTGEENRVWGFFLAGSGGGSRETSLAKSVEKRGEECTN